jgi:hypothetical protein
VGVDERRRGEELPGSSQQRRIGRLAGGDGGGEEESGTDPNRARAEASAHGAA